MSFAKKKKDQPADLFLEWLLSVLADPKKKISWLIFFWNGLFRRLRWPESQGSASEQVGVIVAIDRLIEAPAYNQTQTFGARDFKLC